MSQLAWQVVRNNNNVFVMDFSLDDPKPDKLARMIASEFQITINAVKTPLNYTSYPLMLARRKLGMLQLKKNVNKYKPYDATFSTYIEDIEAEIAKILVYFETHNINKKLVVFIDNFHDLNIKSLSTLNSNEKYNKLAQLCADIAINYDIILICTAELRKINGNFRPTLDSIREASKIKYEAKAIMLVYNDLHYNGDNATIYFTKGNDIKRPIFEVHFAKNKFGTYKGINFFEFYPHKAYMKECTEAKQKEYRNAIKSN